MGFGPIGGRQARHDEDPLLQMLDSLPMQVAVSTGTPLGNTPPPASTEEPPLAIPSLDVLWRFRRSEAYRLPIHVCPRPTHNTIINGTTAHVYSLSTIMLGDDVLKRVDILQQYIDGVLLDLLLLDESL